MPIGGRGKAGGIAVVDTPEEAQREAARILAMDIRGYPVRSVWCETGLDIDAELYLGITLDRDRRRLVIIFSAAGGMEIEQVAVEAPERIAKLWPDPFAGPQPLRDPPARLSRDSRMRPSCATACRSWSRRSSA